MAVVGVNQTAVDVPGVRKIYSASSSACAANIFPDWGPNMDIVVRNGHVHAKCFEDIYLRGIGRAWLLDTDDAI